MKKYTLRGKIILEQWKLSLGQVYYRIRFTRGAYEHYEHQEGD